MKVIKLNISVLKKNKFKTLSYVVISLLLVYFSTILVNDVLGKIIGTIIDVDLPSLIRYLIIFMAIILMNVMFEYASKLMEFEIGKKLVYKLEDEILNHYSKLKLWSSNINFGEILAIFRQNIISSTKEFFEFLSSVMKLVFSILIASIYIIGVDYRILVVCLLIIIIVMIISQREVKKLPFMSEGLVKDKNKLHALIWENIKNSEITGYINQDVIISEYIKSNDKYLENWLAIKKIYNKSQLFAQFGSKILILLVAFLVILFNKSGNIDIPKIFSVILLIPILSDYMFQIPSKIAEYNQIKGKIETIDSIFREDCYFYDGEKKDSNPIKELSIENISYTYSGYDKAAIRNITHKFGIGLTSIVGESGSGKTTTIKLVLGLLQLPQGNIYYNGKNISNIDRDELWSKIGYLPQKPIIFKANLLKNITLGNIHENHEERLKKALEDADLYDAVKSRKLSLEDEISYQNISMGEAQKVCLARMFYGDYSVYIMDEVISAIDVKSEKHVVQKIKDRIKKNRIIGINISHRPSVITSSDEILLIQEGKILDKGSHHHLMNTSSEYKELVKKIM